MKTRIVATALTVLLATLTVPIGGGAIDGARSNEYDLDLGPGSYWRRTWCRQGGGGIGTLVSVH